MLANRTATLILAAGGSIRFGSAKAAAVWLAGHDKTTLLAHAIDTAKTAGEDTGGALLVVTGGHAAAVAPLLTHVDHIHNERWQDGIGGSTALGCRTLLERHPQLRHLLIMTIDQPLTTPAHLQALLVTARREDKVALTTDGLHYGPPACVPARFFHKVLGLAGERGLKSHLTGAEIAGVEDQAAMQDCDTRQALSILAGKA